MSPGITNKKPPRSFILPVIAAARAAAGAATVAEGESTVTGDSVYLVTTTCQNLATHVHFHYLYLRLHVFLFHCSIFIFVPLK